MIVTMEWLERYISIKKECEDIKNRIDELDGWKGHGFSENPTHSTSNEGLDRIIIKREQLYKKYLKKLSKGQAVVLEIEAFLEGVKDPGTRTIIRLKYIDGYTWREVGDFLHLDYSACYRRVEAAIKNNNKNNKHLC